MKAPVVSHNVQQLKKSNWQRSRYYLIFDARANVGLYCVSRNINKPDGIEKKIKNILHIFIHSKHAKHDSSTFGWV